MPKSLFDHDYTKEWPAQEKFPLNEETQGRSVKSQLLPDIQITEDLLIITGFSSIANIIEFFGIIDYEKLKLVRIVLGSEPFVRIAKKLPHYSLPVEIKNYWLKQNISIKLCGPILNLIEKIKADKIIFKQMDNLHSKIYIGDKTAMLGSSNFSKKGIETQRETNIRVSIEGGETEKYQYNSAKQIAENYFVLAEDYKEGIIELLRRLLKDADWEEALARAIAEVLESNWMKEFPELYQAILKTELWPSQRIGISRAMKIIQDQGNVLLADPTGSGKTKLATTLAYTIFHWLGENGFKDRSSALIISPPQVIENWKREQAHFKIYNRIESMGKLSNSKAKTRKELQREIDSKDILIIDEAHNYLHSASKRSKAITPKGSRHIILSTATPINKKADDLLRLIELLDIDNLSDEDLKSFIELRKNKNRRNSEKHLENLSGYINQFIVRRTKKDLNKMIDREPNAYLNHNGHLCRYPEAKSKTYDTGETSNDKKLASDILNLTYGLKGIHYLQKLNIPSYYETEDNKKNYLNFRLKSAPALASFMIRNAMRSSQCALIEYLHGTEEAKKEFGLKESLKLKSGQIIHKIKKCKTTFPKRNFPDNWLPSEFQWLTDEKEYLRVCDEEANAYEQISVLSKQFSGEREKEKARILIEKVNKYNKIIAFDSTVLTLDYLQKLLLQMNVDAEVVVATGQSEKNKNIVKDSFALGSTSNKKLIALCSDAMSEGINLPDAKALILLDMPSVLRVIEQRIGRIERMDSEHKEIHVYWPNDSEEFSLNGDRRMLEILLMTEKVIRNNVGIPDVLYERYLKKDLSTKSLIKTYEEYSEGDYEWEGVKDSTQYLYGLIEGEDALIQEKLYEEFKDVDTTVKTAISFIETDKTWSFFAFRGDSTRSPKWLLIDEKNQAHTEFVTICEKLREYIIPEKINQRRWSEVDTSTEVKNVIRKLRRKEEDLLPSKKKRALKTAKRILEALEKQTSVKSAGRKTIIRKLLDILNPEFDLENLIDYDHFSELWLAVLLPALDKKRTEQIRKRKILSLNDLTEKDVILGDQQLQKIIENCQYANTLDETIAACIIAIKPKE